MASPRKPPKQSSGWGGFLQQAVLSVESHLDTILQDENNPTLKAASTDGKQVLSGSASAGVSRSSSSANKNNDRLQERLARAMAKKKNEARNDSPAPIDEPVSRTATPSNVPAADSEQVGTPRPSSEINGTSDVPSIEVDVVKDSSLPEDTNERVHPSQSPSISPGTTPNRQSLDEARGHPGEIVINGVKAPEVYASPEEMFAYIEKIDALQAKLQYLTKEAVTSISQASEAAGSGSAEKKLLDKEKKITLLMSEGEKLSKTEMKQSIIIKKLRAQATDTVKSQASIKARADKAEASLVNAESRAKRAEAAKRLAEENLEASLDADRNVDALRGERDALTATVAEIRAQLSQTTKRVESAESKAQTEMLAKMTKDIMDLNDDLSSAKIEREISEDKLRREIRDTKALLDKEQNRSRSLESELRAEQVVLESKMESLRNRAEEASSSKAGDTQAKLLRQLETLQTQYSVASENWQGIEGSLLARISNTEKERDELESREIDLRKKLRDMTLKAKQADRASEDARDKVSDVEQVVLEQKGEIRQLQQKNQDNEQALAEARTEFETFQQNAEAGFARRLEEEKSKWKEASFVESPMLGRNESPRGSLRKSSGFRFGQDSIGGLPVAERGPSRRSSILPHTLRSSNTPPRQDSYNSAHSYANGTVLETPISQVLDNDDYFPEPPTPNSLGGSRGVNELMSVSTVGAGPSVQLVERMSASVRRLESEKVANRDELARLTTQRDGARKEIVSLMREIEQKRVADDRIVVLEKDLEDLNEKHQTTLEMLGEKSEMVEELKADVADVKQMYRELVDTTMK